MDAVECLVNDLGMVTALLRRLIIERTPALVSRAWLLCLAMTYLKSSICGSGSCTS